MTDNRADDYGLGLCHTCVKEVMRAAANGDGRGKASGPRFAVTLAPALVPVPTPDGDTTAYMAAVTLPACMEHLELAANRPPEPPRPPRPPRSPLIVP